MTALSELLPAGGAGKVMDFVASGTLPNGQAVVLKSNGQVEAVGETAVAASSGTPTVFGGNYVSYINAAKLSNTKVIVCYMDASNSQYGTACVLSISGSTITAGSPVVFHANATAHISVTALSETKAIVVYHQANNNGYGTTGVLSISGSTITAGSAVVFESANSLYTSVTMLTSTTAIVVYTDTGNSYRGTACLLTVSGSTVTAGTPMVFRSSNSQWITVATLSDTKVIVMFRLGNGYVTSCVLTISGSSISAGAVVSFNSSVSEYISVAVLNPEKVIVAYMDDGNSKKGKAAVLNISGSTVSSGSVWDIFTFNNADTRWISIAKITNTQAIVSYMDNGNSAIGTSRVLNISGYTISGETASVFNSSGTKYNSIVDLENSKSILVYRNDTGNGLGKSIVLQTATDITNLTSTNFVGITAEAITSGATGVVVPQGGVAASVANTPLLQVYGSEVVFNTSNVGWPTMDFDPNTAGKFVAVYSDPTNSNYGTAIVGIVSGNSITYGSKFVFEAAAANDICISFDPNTAGKFVIAYQDAGSASNGTAIVGTVSGTSLSFGTKAVFNSGDSSNIGLDCDPNTANKYVISYRNSANNNEGIALVGTVSGTSISFGSKVTFTSGITGKTSPAFDPNTSGKFVQIWINYSVSNYAEACVGTVSGTSISFGSTVSFDTGGMNWNKIAADPNTANKYVIAYTDQGNSSYGTAIVGTVSGTSISFGTSVVYNSGTTSYNSIGFDPNNSGKCVIAYQDTPNSSSGTAVMGTVSGTSISFGSEVVFNGNSSYFTTVFDPNTAGKYVISYRDSNGPGAAIVGNLSTALTIGSNYYVQADGTVSTVSTSPAVNIGKALNATTLKLKGLSV